MIKFGDSNLESIIISAFLALALYRYPVRSHGDDEMNSGHLQLHDAQKPTIALSNDLQYRPREVDSFIGDTLKSSVLGIILLSMCDAKRSQLCVQEFQSPPCEEGVSITQTFNKLRKLCMKPLHNFVFVWH